MERDNLLSVYPIGGQADLSAYNKLTGDFRQKLSDGIARGASKIDRDIPELRLWHIAGSEARISKHSNLITFYELDSPTQQELAILSSYDNVVVTSRSAKSKFEEFGLKNINYVPLGFDNKHFFETGKDYYPKEVTVFSIFGKFEYRKRHAKAIKAWIKKYKNRRDVILHTHVANPHFSAENHQMIYADLFGGAKPFNVNVLPFSRTLGELNEAYNATDIVIDMSGAEGFSLPSFHCLALGKHGVIHNCTAMKDWANDENAVLVQPSKKIPAYDGVFFQQGAPFNQGNIFDWEEEAFIEACEKALARKLNNKENAAGKKLQSEFSWEKTADSLTSIIAN
jgi:glycosyltransferase involved in cell wall biosynthesis